MISPRTRSPYPDTVKLAKLLLVEGETPAHFFEALAVHLGLEKVIEIRSFGGITNLHAGLTALVKSHGFEATVQSLGITRDAEADANAARQSVQYALDHSGLATSIRRSAFIIPDDTNPGMIETLCLTSVSSKPHFPCVDQYITSAQQNGAAFPAGLAIAKSRLQVYMAAHPDPQLLPGWAASRGFFPFTDPVFQNLIAFMRAL